MSEARRTETVRVRHGGGTISRGRRHRMCPDAARRRRAPFALVALLVAGTVIGGGIAPLVQTLSAAGQSPMPHATGPTSSDWTVYHGEPAGTGVDTSGNAFSPATRAWSSTALDGELYGEPLEATGRVFVATENDTVYALAADSGSVLWSVHLATPVPSSKLPCGDISPSVGITGTPVIDASRGEIFVVADTWNGSAAAHILYGLNLYTGAVMMSQDVDPPGQAPLDILQRTGLNLDNGLVVFGYGGNDGDCAAYHGWVMGVPENGGQNNYFEVDSGSGESQGAIWMGGAAPEVDTSGNVWLAAGNGSVTNMADPYDDSDSVLELSASLRLEQFFAPSTWYNDNLHDYDLGSGVPALMPDGTVFQGGKSQIAYLLSQADLGGIGGQLTSSGSYCGNDVDGGNAVVGDVVFNPCENGVTAVQVGTGPPSLHVQWTTSTGSSGPPIVAGGLVWTISQGGDLYGLNPSTGALVQSFSLGGVANHFPTPSSADGLLLAPATDTVVAFDGPAGLPGVPSPSPPPPPGSTGYWSVASDGGVFTYGGAGFYGSTGGQALVRPIVGMAPTADGKGYWLVASDGGVFSFGDADFYGSMGGKTLTQPIVGLAPTADGKGYWLVASDGGIFSFGDARFYGSMGGVRLNKPIVGMASTADGQGYWLVASDGGIFSFGNATFHGSTGSVSLNKPIVGLAPTKDGQGYWLVASDGGIFSFGDAVFHGSAGGARLNKPIVGLALTPDGQGYWLVASDGGIFSFGDATFWGSAGDVDLNKPIVGMAAFMP
jgi:outer membrane protein assembly factor BamB